MAIIAITTNISIRVKPPAGRSPYDLVSGFDRELSSAEGARPPPDIAGVKQAAHRPETVSQGDAEARRQGAVIEWRMEKLYPVSIVLFKCLVDQGFPIYLSAAPWKAAGELPDRE